MTGKSASANPAHALDPEQLELAPGTEHAVLEGWIPALASDQEIFDALEKAFDYRGDVTITLKNGEVVEGYIFDRRTGSSLADSSVRLFPKEAPGKRTIAYSDIAGLAFTGKDRASGASWEAWVRKWKEKKASGEKGFGLHPEKLE